MSAQHDPLHESPPPASSSAPVYEIRLQGHLGGEWAAWFDGMILTCHAHGESWLVGPVLDQAALHGLLRKIRDLGLPLLAVTCLDANPHDPDEAH